VAASMIPTPPQAGKIYLGDCLEIMRTWPDKSIAMTFTSPPYNFDAGSGLGNKYSGNEDGLGQDAYYEWQKAVIEELLRISEVSFYNIQYLAGNRIALMKLLGHFAPKIKEVFIWDKMGAEPAMNEKVANSGMEFIFCFGEGSRKIESATFERGTFSNVLRIPKNTGTIPGHSACMPIKLALTMIKNFSKEGDLIFDPFTGSGTTALAAEQLGRRWVGTELVAEYHKIAVERLGLEAQQGKLF